MLFGRSATLLFQKNIPKTNQFNSMMDVLLILQSVFPLLEKNVDDPVDDGTNSLLFHSTSSHLVFRGPSSIMILKPEIPVLWILFSCAYISLRNFWAYMKLPQYLFL